MPDESVTTEVKTGRKRWWLLLALVPIAAGTLWLASSPSAIWSAAITDDGSYVVTAMGMGLTPQQWEVRRLDLRTGQRSRMPRLLASPPSEFSTDHRWLESSVKGRQLTSLSVIRVDDFSEEAVPDPSRWKTAPTLLEDRRLIGFDHDGDLRLVDLRSGSDEHFPLPPTNARRSTIQLETPDRVLVLERPLGGGADKWRLISLTEPIKQLAEWNSAQYWLSKHGDFLYTFNSDRDCIEVLSIEDGSAVLEYDLKPLFKQYPGAELGRIVTRRKAVVIWAEEPQLRFLLYELETHRVVEIVHGGLKAGDNWEKENILIVGKFPAGLHVEGLTIPSSRRNPPNLEILDLCLFRAVRASAGQSQVIAVSRDGMVKIFDEKTGVLLRTYGSQAPVRPVFGCVLAGFFVWSVLWVRAGVRLKASPLMEAITLNGLIAAAFIARVNLSGSMMNSIRTAYQVAQWLLASWLVLLMCWFVFGKARWSLRMPALLLGLAGTFTLGLTNFRGHDGFIWEWVIGAFGVAIIGGLWSGLLRLSGFVASRDDTTPISIPLAPARWSIPLRDLFLMTAAVAVLLGVLRFVTPSGLVEGGALMLTLIATAVSLKGVAAIWAGLSPRDWFWRLLLLILIVVVAALSELPTVLLPYGDWERWWSSTKSQTFVVLFTLGTSLIFRAHGWRLRRVLRA